MSSRYGNKKTCRCTGQEAGSYPREADRVAQRSPRRQPGNVGRRACTLCRGERMGRQRSANAGTDRRVGACQRAACTVATPTSRISIHMQRNHTRSPSYVTAIGVRWPASALRPSSARESLPKNFRRLYRFIFGPNHITDLYRWPLRASQ